MSQSLQTSEMQVGMRRMLYAASFLVLAVGVSLYFLSAQTDRYFAWTINPPLTAAFLGACYLASFFLEFFSARERYWVNARVAVPAVWLFTTLTLIITLLHLNLFHFEHPSFITRLGTWVWLVVYVSVPIMLGVLWFLQWRRRPLDPPRQMPLPGWVRGVMHIQSLLFCLMGVGLLLFTTQTMPAWPWALKPLAARAVGAWCVSLGVIAAHGASENSWERVRPLLVGYFALGLLQLIALVRYTADFDWSSPSGILYSLAVLSFLMIGVYGMRVHDR